MNLLGVFCYTHGIIHIALHAAIFIGIFLEWRRDRLFSGKAAENVKVSVIIPIHNESQRIKGLLRSLLFQTYPAQVVFIDDCSSDESPAMLAQFADDAAKQGVLDCRIITLIENPGPNRKQFALSKGIAEANGDYFLFTDGDCEVPPGWIQAMLCRINKTGKDKSTGVVIGPVFKKNQGKGFFSFFQCFDHIVRYNYLTGAVGLGAAGGGFGNNLIVSKVALDSVGGYENIPLSQTEDASLISQIRKNGKFNVHAITYGDAAVETESEKTFSDFLNQTLRWNNGGLFSPEILTRINYNLLMLIISTGILTLAILPFYPALWPLPVGVLISMLGNITAVILLYQDKLPNKGFAVKFMFFLSLFFTPLYTAFLTIMGYAGVKPVWK